MKKRILMMTAAVVVGLSAGWLLPAQQAPAGPTWKDTKEWEEAQEYAKGTTDAQRLAALEKWAKDYPNSDVWQTRDELYLSVYNNMKDNRKLFDKAKEIRAKKPEHYFAITTILNTIFLFPSASVAPADLVTAEETAKYVMDNNAKVFDEANKPANVTDAQWTQFKPAVNALAQRVYAYVPVVRKDYPKAEVETTKVIKEDATQAQFSYFLGTALIQQKVPEKIAPGIFHLARAASYDGQNALPAAARQQALPSVTSIYKQYHGSEEGLPEVLALAKNNAFPPADFKIESKSEIELAKFADQEAFDKAHPDLAFWRDAVKVPLTGPDGDKLFTERYKGSALPPPGESFPMFTAKIVSLTPETNPKEIVAALADPNVADVKLTFDDPLPGTMMPGEDIKFKGTVTAYAKEPFMVTFDVDPAKELSGWTGKGAAKGKQPATKGGATKGKNKGK